MNKPIRFINLLEYACAIIGMVVSIEWNIYLDLNIVVLCLFRLFPRSFYHVLKKKIFLKKDSFAVC